MILGRRSGSGTGPRSGWGGGNCSSAAMSGGVGGSIPRPRPEAEVEGKYWERAGGRWCGSPGQGGDGGVGQRRRRQGSVAAAIAVPASTVARGIQGIGRAG